MVPQYLVFSKTYLTRYAARASCTLQKIFKTGLLFRKECAKITAQVQQAGILWQVGPLPEDHVK
jgi:outer membrane PBP1 activator LpoA protein